MLCRLKAALPALCCLTALILGCGRKSTAPQDPDAPVVVKTVAVESTTTSKATTQPATIVPFYRAEIRGMAHGYVTQIHADIGDFVEANAPLATIDVPELEVQRQVLAARITRFQSEEVRARAGVEIAKASVITAESNLAQTTAELKQAQASLAAAEAEFTRTSDLVDQQSLQARLLDEVRKNRDSVAASRDASQAAIDAAKSKVQLAKAKLTSAESDLKAAKADTIIAERQLDELDVKIDFAVVKSPFAGIVTQRNLDPGDLVSNGDDQTPLFVVIQVDKVRAHVMVPESAAATVNKGDPVKLTFPSFPNETIEATVSRHAGALDTTTRTMLVEAVLDNPQRRLLPGMFGQATITSMNQIAANVLPARAVRFDESGNAFVYAIANDTVEIKPVETGMDNGRTIEVMGLESGQLVVDAHRKRFSTGDLIRAAN